MLTEKMQLNKFYVQSYERGEIMRRKVSPHKAYGEREKSRTERLHLHNNKRERFYGGSEDDDSNTRNIRTS